jgi:hypothetical protein
MGDARLHPPSFSFSAEPKRLFGSSSGIPDENPTQSTGLFFFPHGLLNFIVTLSRLCIGFWDFAFPVVKSS